MEESQAGRTLTGRAFKSEGLPQIKAVRMDRMPTNDVREAIVAGFHILAEREKRDVLEIVRECYNALSRESITIVGQPGNSPDGHLSA